MSSKQMPATLDAFYAHVLGLEYECEHRLIDLSRTLDAHHNPEAAEIFAKAEKMRADNIRRINLLCEDLELPRIAPWDYYWHQYVNIESLCIDSIHYMITAFEAVELVLKKLDAARDFYREIANASELPAIQEAAEGIIELLESEIETVRGWQSGHEAQSPPADLDPPHQPE